jgi:NADPH:quinone reductase-like Zn-dependent oxidoreductase
VDDTCRRQMNRQLTVQESRHKVARDMCHVERCTLTMSRAVVHETFGGPKVLELREVTVGLNPMDWILISMPAMAEQFGITLPAGFDTDFAVVVDQVGEGVTGFTVGYRVYGGTLSRAAADYAVVDPATDSLLHTPDALSDQIAATPSVAGLTASAALAAIGVQAGNTVLIGNASGGGGVLAVQLAKLAGARVIGTPSEGTFDFPRDLGERRACAASAITS